MTESERDKNMPQYQNASMSELPNLSINLIQKYTIVNAPHFPNLPLQFNIYSSRNTNTITEQVFTTSRATDQPSQFPYPFFYIHIPSFLSPPPQKTPSQSINDTKNINRTGVKHQINRPRESLTSVYQPPFLQGSFFSRSFFYTSGCISASFEGSCVCVPRSYEYRSNYGVFIEVHRFGFKTPFWGFSTLLAT